MSDPIPIQSVSVSDYWSDRLGRAIRMEELHRAVYETTRDEWDAIERDQKHTLLLNIKPNDRVLDCGCGYGRLIPLMPDWWSGHYVGVDISEELIHLARIAHPKRRFIIEDLKRMHEEFQPKQFDVAIFCSMRGMLQKHIGEDEWQAIYKSVSQVVKSVLFMDYDGSHERVEL